MPDLRGEKLAGGTSNVFLYLCISVFLYFRICTWITGIAIRNIIVVECCCIIYNLSSQLNWLDKLRNNIQQHLSLSLYLAHWTDIEKILRYWEQSIFTEVQILVSTIVPSKICWNWAQCLFQAQLRGIKTWYLRPPPECWTTCHGVMQVPNIQERK